MNQTARIFACLIALSTVITPSHAIEIRTWKYLTGLGAIGGAIIGAAIYKKHHDSKKQNEPIEDQSIEIENEKDPKNQNSLSISAAIGSASIGAAASAFAVAVWFYQFRPDARLARAEALYRSAVDENRINAVIDFNRDNPNRPIEEMACTLFRRYPLVYAEQNMYNGEQKLIQATRVCLQAVEDANGDAILALNCDNVRMQADHMAEIARINGRNIRMHPRYQAEVAAEGREQIAQRHAAAAERTARAAEIRALTPKVTVVHHAAPHGNAQGQK